MELRCPACSRAVLNRRLPDCEFCGARIPDELLLSMDERAAIADEHAEKSAEQRKVEREREREKRRKRTWNDPMPFD